MLPLENICRQADMVLLNDELGSLGLRLAVSPLIEPSFR